jgi:hypothetical protein
MKAKRDPIHNRVYMREHARRERQGLSTKGTAEAIRSKESGEWGKRNGIPWAHDEVLKLYRLVDEQSGSRVSWVRIAKEMDRSLSSCFNKYRDRTDVSEPVREKSIPPHVLQARDIRSAAYDARDYTASKFGDPPIGFSALDARREG